MKKTLFSFISLLVVLGLTGIAEADSFTTAADGNWSVSGTWSGSNVPDSADDTITLSHTTSQNIANLAVESINFAENKILTLSGQDLTVNTLTNTAGKTLSGINLNGRSLTIRNDNNETTNYAGRIYTGTLNLNTTSETLPTGTIILKRGSGAVGGSQDWTNITVNANKVRATIGTSSELIKFRRTDPAGDNLFNITNGADVDLFIDVNEYNFTIDNAKANFGQNSVVDNTSILVKGTSKVISYAKITNATLNVGVVDGTTNPYLEINDHNTSNTDDTVATTTLNINDGGRVRIITGAIYNNDTKEITIRGKGLFNTGKNGRLWVEAGAEVKKGVININLHGEVVAFGNIKDATITLNGVGVAPPGNYGAYLGIGDESDFTNTTIVANADGVVATADHDTTLKSFTFKKDSGLAIAFYNLDKNFQPTTFTAGNATAAENSIIEDGTYIYLSPWTQYSSDGKTRTPRFKWSEMTKEFKIAAVPAGKTLTNGQGGNVDVSKLVIRNIWLRNAVYTATPTFELRNGNRELWARLAIRRTHAYGEKATTPNNQSVAGALDQLRIAETPATSTLITALDSSPTTAALNYNLEQLSPQSLLSAPFMVQLTQNASTRQFSLYRNHRRRAASGGMPYSISLNPSRSGLANRDINPRNALAQALPETPGARQDREVGMDKMVNIFARATTSYTRMGSRDDRIGFNASTVGTVFGIDFKIHENMIVGVGGSYNYIDIDLAGSRGGGRINSYRVGPYFLMFADKWFFETEATIGFHNNKFGRKINVGSSVNEKANSKYDALDFTVTVGAGYDFEIGGFTLTPRTDLQYQYYNSDSFNERGAATSNLHVDSYENSSLISRFGVELWKKFDFDHHALKSATPFITVGYRREWLKPDDLTSRFIAGGSAFKTDNNVYSRNNIYIGAGTSLELTDQLNLDLKYQAEIGTRNTHTHDAYISLRYNF